MPKRDQIEESLLEMITDDNFDALKKLLENTALNSKEVREILKISVSRNARKIAFFLINNKLNLYQLYSDTQAAYDIAVLICVEEIQMMFIKFALENNKPVLDYYLSKESKQSIMFKAARTGNTFIIRYLSESGANLAEEDEIGFTIADYAADIGDIKTLRFIAGRVGFRMENSQGFTIFQRAVLRNSVKAMESLITLNPECQNELIELYPCIGGIGNIENFFCSLVSLRKILRLDEPDNKGYRLADYVLRQGDYEVVKCFFKMSSDLRKTLTLSFDTIYYALEKRNAKIINSIFNEMDFMLLYSFLKDAVISGKMNYILDVMLENNINYTNVVFGILKRPWFNLEPEDIDILRILFEKCDKNVLVDLILKNSSAMVLTNLFRIEVFNQCPDTIFNCIAYFAFCNRRYKRYFGYAKRRGINVNEIRLPGGGDIILRAALNNQLDVNRAIYFKKFAFDFDIKDNNGKGYSDYLPQFDITTIICLRILFEDKFIYLKYPKGISVIFRLKVMYDDNIFSDKINKLMNFGNDNYAFLAVYAGDINFLKYLSQNEKYLFNQYNEEGGTPCHLAAEKNDIKMIYVMLKNGFDIKSKNLQGETVFDILISNGNNKAIIYLAKKGYQGYSEKYQITYITDRNGAIIDCSVSQNTKEQGIDSQRKDGDRGIHHLMDMASRREERGLAL